MQSLAVSTETFHKADFLPSPLSDNTQEAYRKAWEVFEEYCAGQEIEPMSATPQEVAEFLIGLAKKPRLATGKTLAMGTIEVYKCGLNRRFVDADLPSPTRHRQVMDTMKGLARLYGAAPRRVKALREHQILRMIAVTPDSLIGLRDAAILALGFSAALRRSELCGLKVNNLNILRDEKQVNKKMLITIDKSKTDQAGKGQQIAVMEGKHIKPISRVQRWLKEAGITNGHIFRTMRRGGSLRGEYMHHSDIPRIVKQYAAAIGLDPREVAGHSLRAGFVTSAAAHHARLDKIMAVTRHTNTDTVMKYIRDADRFADHAGQGFL